MDPIEALGLPKSRWVDVDGPVHYREWTGPEGGPTFVCVHGLGGSHLNWAAVAPGLARHGRVLALDLAGFGLSPPEGRDTSVRGNARLLDGFLRTLGLPPVILVGNSMGGMLSLIQAARRPETVEAMVLVDAAFPRPRWFRARPAAEVVAVFVLYAIPAVGGWFVTTRARRLGAEGLVRVTLEVCAADPSSIDPRLVAAHVEMARRRMDLDYAAEAFLAAARSIFRSQAIPARYRALVREARRPALVLHGTEDRLVPLAAAREAAAAHPEWKLVELGGLGHVPQMEAPDRWLGAVEGWLAERGGRGLRAPVARRGPGLEPATPPPPRPGSGRPPPRPPG
jgi:pimeloyl-ACP methyl ester carboxylesterase